MEIVRKTIGQMLNEITEQYPNNEALIHREIGIRYNYALFLWEVNRTAKGLMKMGIQKGDRVALWAPNIPEWVTVQMALAKIGAILVPVDPGIGRDDLRYILEQSDTSVVVLARGLEDTEYVDMIMSVRDEVPSLVHIIVAATQTFPELIPFAELAAMGDDVSNEDLEKREQEIKPDDPVAVMYTSGTTGKPKGVVLDHLGLVNKSLCSTQRQGLNHKDRICLFFPLFHMFGNTCIALSGLLVGSTLVMPCLAFDPRRILKSIDKEKCTAIYGSPSMIIALLDHAQFNKKKWASVTKGILGGAPCPMELMTRIVEDVGITGITVAYGITEASSWITMTHPDDPLETRVSTIGTPLPCNELKIVDALTGEDLPPDTQGELCVRHLLMKEYYKMPKVTAEAIDSEGWFHSGDLGEMDGNGYVKITGRMKDVIVRDGIEIHPTLLEEILYKLPEVSEVQVFGFPDPTRGHEVAAWIKLKEGAHLSLDGLSDYARREMGKERAPQYYKFVTEFPMTRSGKVQKFKLAQLAHKEYH